VTSSAAKSFGAGMMKRDIARFYADPLGFVRYAFNWNERGGPLENHLGPDDWQREILEEVARVIRANDAAHQFAVASGHGIGKGALTAWLILWAMSTRPHLNAVVTANTRSQLETKTWRELAVWHQRAVNKDWFDWTATRFAHRRYRETWFAAALPWSENNSEAFAGLHAENVLMIFDEASAIPDSIWDVAEGAMTTAGALWFVFGNPTRNSGRFRECFGRFRHRWSTRQIDSRDCRLTDKRKLGQWVEDYGNDSDFVRVRVKGEFPRAGSSQFISSEAAEAAARREAASTLLDPLVFGLDVARFGDDRSVLVRRRGRDARTDPPLVFRGLDTMQLAGRVAEQIEAMRPDAVFIDETGVGGGVVDRLRQLGHGVVGVNFGARGGRGSDGASALYANKGAEIWGAMKAWLEAGGAIPDDRALVDDLTGRDYGFNARNEIQLESKEDMKRRGLASPDLADALALTFAYPVGPRRFRGAETAEVESAYDPFND
jgi:hypothetical protein